jgi:hypothetical protein
VCGCTFHRACLVLQPEWRVWPFALRWRGCRHFTYFFRLAGGWLNTPFLALQVDPERFELSTFSMPLRRAPNCAMGPYFPSGPGGIRTLGLVSAIDARSQLRYRPFIRVGKFYPNAAVMSRTHGRLRVYHRIFYALPMRVLIWRIAS